ncbi:MAG: protein translocase subunit SecF [Candidatus Pacearchaeota archaeon]
MTKTEEKTESNREKSFSKRFGKFHDKNYKKLLIIPAAIFLFCFVYMFIFYSANGDIMYKDISLTGGTSVTIHEPVDILDLDLYLSENLESYHLREISDPLTRQQIAMIVETTADASTSREVIEEYLGHELNEENSSFEFTGSALSQDFFRQLIVAVLLAFAFMALVVFILFRTLIPSAAVVISAFANILMTLTVFNIAGFSMSTAGIVAFLMLIGYSVDTDILLTNRVLKREGSVNERFYSAFTTGMTMTLTSLLALSIALLIVMPFSAVLTSIFMVLVIGLGFDLINTWVTNVSILKWYVEREEK